MLSKYTQEKEFLSSVEATNQREIISEQQAAKLVSLFPNIPLDYIDYLKEIGAGSFRDSHYMVYSNLMELQDFGLQESYPKASHIKFFGDNFSGDLAGFDLSKKDGFVIELWHDTGELHHTKKKFKDYIRERLKIKNSGNKHKNTPWWKIW